MKNLKDDLKDNIRYIWLYYVTLFQFIKKEMVIYELKFDKWTWNFIFEVESPNKLKAMNVKLSVFS